MFDIDKDGNETATTRWKVAGLIFAVILISSAFDLYDRIKVAPGETERILAGSGGLQRADELFRSLPVPPGVRFLHRSVGGNTTRDAMDYAFGPDDDFAEIGSHYEKWLIENGWRKVDGGDFDYRKGNFSVSIEDVGEYYSINCAEVR